MFSRFYTFNRILMAKNLSADSGRGHSTLIAVIPLKQKAYSYPNFVKTRRTKWGHWTYNAFLDGTEVPEFVIKEKCAQWMINRCSPYRDNSCFSRKDRHDHLWSTYCIPYYEDYHYVFLSVGDLQNYAIFWCTAKLTQSYIHVYIYTHSFSYVIFYHSLSRETGYSSLRSTVGPYCLSMLNVIVCID